MLVKTTTVNDNHFGMLVKGKVNGLKNLRLFRNIVRLKRIWAIAEGCNGLFPFSFAIHLFYFNFFLRKWSCVLLITHPV